MSSLIGRRKKLSGIKNLIMMKLADIFYYVGSGSGFVCAERSDPDPVQKRTGSQHCPCQVRFSGNIFRWTLGQQRLEAAVQTTTEMKYPHLSPPRHQGLAGGGRPSCPPWCCPSPTRPQHGTYIFHYPMATGHIVRQFCVS
jgi:hypothetical protein